MAQAALVGLSPVAHLVDALALGAHVGEGLHEQTVAARGRQRVDDIELAVGILGRQLGRRLARRLVGGRDARRQRGVQHVLALLQEAAEILEVVARAHSGRLGVGAVCHGAVEVLERNGLAQVVAVVAAIEHEVEADVFHVDGCKFFGGQVGR